MATFSNIDGEESATVTFRVGTVQITRGSTAEEQEILCLGDPDSSNAIAAVTAAAPASTRWGLNVRVIGGPSSLADFAVRAVLPSTATDNPVSAAQASTVWAVQVDGRVRAQNSTIGDFLASVQQNSTVWQVQLSQYSTIAAISSLAGVVTAAPVSASGVSMSTDADPASTKQGLIVRQVGFSTIAAVSSVAGIVAVRPSDTNWGSSAGFHFDSSGALNVNSGAASTQVTASLLSSSGVSMSTDTAPASTKQGLIVRQVGFTIDSSGALQVNTGPGGSTQVTASLLSSSGVSMSTDTDPASTKQGLIVRQVGFSSLTARIQDSSGIGFGGSTAAPPAGVNALAVRVLGGSTGASAIAADQSAFTTNVTNQNPIGAFFTTTASVVPEAAMGVLRMSSGRALFTNLRDDTNGSITDSTQRAVRVFDISGSTQVAISSGILQAQLISSSGVSMSTDTAPASTKQGLIVWPVGYSTIMAVSSVAGVVAIQGNSTAVIVSGNSSVIVTSGNSTVFAHPSDTSWLSSAGAHFDSSGALVTAQNNTGWLISQISSVAGVLKSQIMDSSNVTPNIVGTRPTTNAQGLAVRTILNDLQSTFISTAGNNSTSNTVVSSAATRVKVYAYSITSTNQTINNFRFASSGANEIWGVTLQSMSSGISGANLAVTPPAWLFATAANEALSYKIGTGTGTYSLSFSYFTEA